MKRNVFSLLVLTTILLASCTTMPEPIDTPPKETNKPTTRWDEIVKAGELKIGVNTLDSSFDNDLIDEFSKESKLTVKKVLLDDDEKENALNNNEVDFLWSQIPDSSENSLQYSLSEPYFHCSILTVVKNADAVNDRKIIGTLLNSVSTELAFREEKTVKKADDIKALFSLLRHGSVDAIYINKETYNNLGSQTDDLTVAAEIETKLVLAFKQNDKAVKTEVEKVMAKIKANGTASEISEKWYNNDFIIK